MIPINELRIGNYVNGDKDGISVVTSIERYKDRIGITPLTFNYYSFTNQSISPIPLTREILEKCGWISNKICCYLDLNEDIYLSFHKDGNFFLVIKNNDEDSDCEELFTKLNIKYLHQLQNLIYSLVGEELTYKP